MNVNIMEDVSIEIHFFNPKSLEEKYRVIIDTENWAITFRKF
ncbi:MAG: hypothetical protein QXO82_05865 [Candidatus Methanomethylicia archaeon]